MKLRRRAGGDHCGSASTGTTTATYQQPFSYDALDRFNTGPSGVTTYSATHIHAAVSLGNVPSPYASYDDMGNMTCRNVDATTAHSCGISQTGAQMTYDNEGRLASWTAPSGTSASDLFLYDNAGNRVLQRTTNGTTISKTITFDSYTETTLTGSITSTTKYYSADGSQVALRKDGLLSYSVADTLGSNSVVLKSDGTPQAIQLFAPFGTQRYSDGSMPTTNNFTGQRLDSQTGLLYYGFRYYDPVSGRFTRTDTTITNAQGTDTYAYVGSNPEGRTDANGHCWPLCTAIAGAIIGGIIGGVASAVIQSQHGGKINWGSVGAAAAGGAAVGALVGAVGPAAITGIAAIGTGLVTSTATVASVSATVAVTAGEAATAATVGLSVGGAASTIAGGSGVLAQDASDWFGVEFNYGLDKTPSFKPGWFRAQDYRSQYKIKSGGNVAFADYNVAGSSGTDVANSGRTVPGTIPGSSNPQFALTVVPGTPNVPRQFDSENKLFENFASQFSQDDSGSIDLYSELPLCLSCDGVSSQFDDMFPNIDLNINWGLFD